MIFLFLIRSFWSNHTWLKLTERLRVFANECILSSRIALTENL